MSLINIVNIHENRNTFCTNNLSYADPDSGNADPDNGNLWDFGDGQSSPLPSVSHTYASGCWYVAGLSIECPCGATQYVPGIDPTEAQLKER